MSLPLWLQRTRHSLIHQIEEGYRHRTIVLRLANASSIAHLCEKLSDGEVAARLQGRGTIPALKLHCIICCRQLPTRRATCRLDSRQWMLLKSTAQNSLEHPGSDRMRIYFHHHPTEYSEGNPPKKPNYKASTVTSMRFIYFLSTGRRTLDSCSLHQVLQPADWDN